MADQHVRIRLFSTGSARKRGFRVDWSRLKKRLCFYIWRTNQFGELEMLRWQVI